MIRTKKEGPRLGTAGFLAAAAVALLAALPSLMAAPPQPHGVAGWIFQSDGSSQVPLGTDFSVNDTVSGDYVRDKTSVPVPGYTGRYSVSISGNDGDAVIVLAWNSTHYGRRDVVLQGDMDNVNVTLNITRPPEANVTILFPGDSAVFNMSQEFNTTANITFSGGSGTGCNATLAAGNESVINISNGESFVKQLGSVSPGDSFVVSWNLTAVYPGSVDITVSARCIESGVVLDSNGQDTARNITVQDIISPNITLISPQNNTARTNNTVDFVFRVNDTGVGTANCSLVLNSSVLETNSSINENTNQSFTRRLSFGTYKWGVRCYDWQGNLGESSYLLLTVTDPDIYVNSSLIFLSKQSPQESDNITINATIQNIGNENASNVVVQFWERNLWGAEAQLGTNITINLTRGGSRAVSLNYTVKVGVHEIIVRADPPLALNGSIDEANESNNEGNTTISVPIWQIAYGDVVNTIVLAASQAGMVASWFNASFLTGNLYAADSDSSVSWSSLLALSRNSSGALRMDDFEELDSALNYSGLPDSVNSTYTAGGSVRNTTTFLVFGKNITGVPIANSTNSSLFYTGILWDSSDGTPEYNGTQDVVFVTNVRAAAQGKYGVYNYEIRMPANLKSYVKPSTGNEIDFYVELN